MKPYILCVIDMQPAFDTAHDEKTIANCVKLCEKAIKDGAPVLIVEFSGHGSTWDKITRLFNDYKNVHTVKKYYNDGSQEITDCCLANGIIPSDYEFRFCGVNLQYCVKETVIGMAYRVPRQNLVVVRNACNGPRGGSKRGLFWGDTHTSKLAVAQELRSNGVRFARI